MPMRAYRIDNKTTRDKVVRYLRKYAYRVHLDGNFVITDASNAAIRKAKES